MVCECLGYRRHDLSQRQDLSKYMQQNRVGDAHMEHVFAVKHMRCGSRDAFFLKIILQNNKNIIPQNNKNK